MRQRLNFKHQSREPYKNRDDRWIARATLRRAAALVIAAAGITAATAQPAQYIDPAQPAMPAARM